MDGDNISFRNELRTFSDGLYSLGIAHRIIGCDPKDIIAERDFLLQDKGDVDLDESIKYTSGENDRISKKQRDNNVPLIKISIKYQNELFGYLFLSNIKISTKDYSSYFTIKEDRLSSFLDYIVSSLDMLSHSAEQAREINLLQMRLSQTNEASNEGVWEYNIKLGKIYYSPKWYTILGYEPDELPQSFDTFLNLIHPEDKDELFAQFKDDVQNGTDFIYEYRLKHKNGDYRWVYTRGKAVEWDSEGNVIRMLGTNKNITERKEAEFELKVSEEKLRQSQKLEAIGRLAGGIAHDFNNLLTAIIGYSDMLSSSCRLSEECRDFLGEIMSAAKRAAALTHQLLAFSRKQVLKPKIIYINELVENIEKMLARLIGEDIRMILSLSQNVKSIKVDPGQMEQVIMNLAVNSRDAMPNGGKLVVKTENITFTKGDILQNEEVEPGEYVMISVTDTGHGIDKANIENIFEPFFTTKEQGKGTGLGLATVYGIVRQTGGYITVDSTPGEGTSFLIYLPAHHATYIAQSKTEVENEIEKGHETILLVEDEDSLRTLISIFLSNLGYNLIVASSGIEALAKLNNAENIKIDLLVTDVIMPEMSGKTLADRLTMVSPDTKVLFISGYTSNEIENHVILDGSVNFLQKPFPVKQLASMIRQILG